MGFWDSDKKDDRQPSTLERIGIAGLSSDTGLAASLTRPNQNMGDRATIQDAFGVFTDTKKMSKLFR